MREASRLRWIRQTPNGGAASPAVSDRVVRVERSEIRVSIAGTGCSGACAIGRIPRFTAMCDADRCRRTGARVHPAIKEALANRAGDPGFRYAQSGLLAACCKREQLSRVPGRSMRKALMIGAVVE